MKTLKRIKIFIIEDYKGDYLEKEKWIYNEIRK